MLPRVLEPEVMDTVDEARDYDSMDHSAVNRAFVADFFSLFPAVENPVLDVGAGTALIPIEVCRRSPTARIIAIDLADEMLKLADRNVAAVGLVNRIKLEKANARELAFPDWHFGAVISNSIIHHIPDPFDCFGEMVRVCRVGGALFVRDLLRPDSEGELQRLVKLYAAGANTHQRSLFANSLRAALTLEEVRTLVGRLGFGAETVARTTDRHWTFATTKPDEP